MTPSNAAGIKAVISDLGGVLIDVDKDNMCARFARHSQLAAEEIGRHLSGHVIHSSGAERELSKGLITPEQFYAAMSKQIKLQNVSFEEFNKIYSDRFTRKPDTIAILRKLSAGYPIAMLSNTNEVHYEYWSRLLGADMKLFKTLILSFEVHLAKPDPAIYLEAAKRLGVQPEECVFIDDVKEYAGAAGKVGMKGIHFISAAQLETDLRKLGVSV